jgi:hypothetical protein
MAKFTFIMYNIYILACPPKAGIIQRQLLRGNSYVNTFPRLPGHVTTAYLTGSRGSHLWLQWCHATRRAVKSGVAMQCSARQTVLLQWNTWHHVTHINTGAVVSVGSVQRLYLENQNTSQPIQVKSLERSLERVCSQTDQSESEAVVWECPWWKRGRWSSLYCCKLLHSKAELIVRWATVSEDMNMWNTEAEGATALKTVNRQLLKTQQTKKT